MTTSTIAKKTFEDLLNLDLSVCEVTVCLASTLKEGQIPRFERLLLSARLTETFRSIAAYVQAHEKKDYNNGDTVLHAYAAESKPDAHEVEFLDLSSYQTILEQISPLSALADVEIFDADEKFIAGMHFYAIAVQPPDGEPAYFFRLYSPRKMLARSRFFAMIYSQGVYDRVVDPLFLFDQLIDCVSYRGIMYIFRKDHFQDIFRFFEMIRNAAKEILESIRTIVPIQNFEAFAHDCESHLPKLVKLKNIAAKPYWGKISMENIKTVIARNNLPVKVVQHGGTEMLVYDPTNKWVLLKLLDDDYLLSLMTEQTYEVTGKREVEKE
ncbi:MAG TPA: Kiwa anti-phage protein KwaB-like domain-containing protein [Ktedonobacteraceae bacterium]|jgi:hypothetical protein|nr:Kiwa anti-phage protein KwaB-like domain-containing protein [Ktedonobacteraceae bacterium]